MTGCQAPRTKRQRQHRFNDGRNSRPKCPHEDNGREDGFLQAVRRNDAVARISGCVQ